MSNILSSIAETRLHEKGEAGDVLSVLMVCKPYQPLKPNWLSNIVKAESGETVLKWIMLALIQNAKVHLGYTDKPVYVIADTLGFSSDVDFSRVFKRETGMTPMQYRKSLEAI